MLIKHLLLIITFLFAISGQSLAQNFNAYLIGGFNISQIEGDKLVGYNKSGFIVGGATNFKLNDQWGFQQEIVYYQRGSRASDTELNADNFTELRIDYIDVLLLPQYLINESWSISGGPGYGFYLNDKSDFNTGVTFTGDLFFVLGPQYKLSEKWISSVRVQYSIIDVIDNRDALNNSINFTLRYKL